MESEYSPYEGLAQILSCHIDYEKSRMGYQRGVWEKKEAFVLQEEGEAGLLLHLKEREKEQVAMKKRIRELYGEFLEAPFPGLKARAEKVIVEGEKEIDLLIATTRKKIEELES